MLERVWLAFLPLFVAFDAIGVLPLYWVLAQGQSATQRRHAVQNAVLIAWLVALAFLGVSGVVLRVMGIEVSDVMIAGGAILFVLSLKDLLLPEKVGPSSTDTIGVVPLGVPLIVGPAVLTTVLLTRQRYGFVPTVGALTLNIVLTWIVLQAGDGLMERGGPEAMKGVSKGFNLILAAFGVMLIRHGVTTLLTP